VSAVTIQIDFTGARAADVLTRIEAGLADPSVLNRRIAARAENLTRDYLRVVASESHKTADKLGAQPTGHLERAAGNVSSRSDAEAATVSVVSPGITRAFRPLEIKARAGGNLTIPIHALAYGRTSRQVEAEVGQRLFRPVKSGAKAQASRTDSGSRRSKIFAEQDRMHVLGFRLGVTFLPMFALVPSVTVPQDRTLLPSDADYQREAGIEAAEYIDDLTRAQGGAA
jgi:hypothetical protein